MEKENKIIRDEKGRFVSGHRAYRKGIHDKQVLLNCDYCGKEINKFQSNIKKHTFCNKGCYNFWQDENLIGKNNPYYGKKHTEEYKLKDKKTKLLFYKSKEGKELIEIMKEKNKGKHLSPETEFKKNDKRLVGKRAWNKEKKCPQISKKLIGKHNSPKTEFKKGDLRISGKNNPLFNNWSSFEPYTKEFNKQLKKAIRERDGCCMLCNTGFEDLSSLKRKTCIHHINYDKKCNLPQNLIILCSKCHGITNKNRPHWTKFFQSMLLERYGYQYSETGEIILNLNQGGKK